MDQYPKEIESIEYRFFRQAYETLYTNKETLHFGDSLNAFNHSINQTGFCPALTTRPEGFKTAIVVVVDE